MRACAMRARAALEAFRRAGALVARPRGEGIAPSRPTEGLLAAYRRMMEVERDYFASHAPASSASRPVLGALAVDFDQTLTQRDTCSLLLGAAEEAQVARAFAEAGGAEAGAGRAEEVRRQRAETLRTLLQQYERERGEAIDRVLRSGRGGGAAAGPAAAAAAGSAPSPSAVLSAMAPLDEAERAAMLRAQALLEGISPHDVALLGRRVALRPGAAPALRRALEGGVEVWVVSVSWSATFVAAALRANGVPATTAVKRDGRWARPDGEAAEAGPSVLVVANELETAPGGGAKDAPAADLRLSTGALSADRRVFCAADKASAFADLLDAARARAERVRAGAAAAIGPGAPSAPLPLGSAYLGDSLTDLSPALLASRAVFFRCGESLARVCDALGVPVVPVSTVDGREEAGAERAANGGEEAAADRAPGAIAVGAAHALRLTDNWLSAENELNAHFALPCATWERAARGAAVDGVGTAAALAPVAALFPRIPTPIRVPKILTIAGSDSSGGAGVEADQRAAQANGARASVGAVALTAQDSRGVHAAHRVPDAFARDAARCALEDAGIDCVKTGMLPDAQAVDEAVEMTRLARHLDPATCLVVDPVLVSTSGDSLADSSALRAIRDRLLPLADVATPNLPEAAALLGRAQPIRGVARAVEAAVELLALGPKWVLVKGGHEEGGDEIVDVLVGRRGEGVVEGAGEQGEGERGLERLFADEGADPDLVVVPPPCPPALVACDRIAVDGEGVAETEIAGTSSPLAEPAVAETSPRLAEPAVAETPSPLADLPPPLLRALRPSVFLLRAPRLESSNLHGTGCTLASSIAARLAAGDGVVDAVRAAKAYVWRTIERSRDLPLGAGPQRSLNHGWAVADWRQAAAARGNASARRLPTPVDLSVYVVTDPGCDARNGRTLVESVAAAVRGGATIVQIRAKDADSGAFVREARQALAVCRAAGVPLVINDRIDVALAIGADGAHIGQTDVPAADARRILGPGLILGVSAVAPDAVRAAARDGADYVGVGAVHATTTKDANVCGVDGLRRSCEIAHQEGLGVVAIGGLNAANLGDAIRAGADGAAIVSAVFGRPDVEQATREIAEAVRQARTGGDRKE